MDIYYGCILTFMSLVVIWPFDCGVVLYGIWWDGGGGCMQVFVFLLGDKVLRPQASL